MTIDRDAAILACAERAATLDEARRCLGALGVRARTRRKVRRVVLEAMARVNAPQRERIEAAAPGPADHLPFTEVLAGGVTYRVHGIVHPQRRLGVTIDESVRRWIAERTAALRADGKDYLIEAGFGRAFGLPRDKEMNIIGASFRSLSIRQKADFGLRLIPAILLLPLAPIIVRLARDRGGRLLFRALRDARFLAPGRELYHLTRQVPADLDLATGDPFVVGMSREMANALQGHARARRLHTMHAVVGLGHEKQIAALLGRQVSERSG